MTQTQVTIPFKYTTYVSAASTSSNYDSSSFIRAEETNISYWAREAILVPDLSQIPTGMRIVSARMYLYCDSKSSKYPYLYAYRSTSPVALSGITWDTRPSKVIGNNPGVNITADRTWYSWDITQQVQEMYNLGRLSNYAIIVGNLTPNVGAGNYQYYATFTKHNSSPTTLHPYLMVTYEPNGRQHNETLVSRVKPITATTAIDGLGVVRYIETTKMDFQRGTLNKVQTTDAGDLKLSFTSKLPTTNLIIDNASGDITLNAGMYEYNTVHIKDGKRLYINGVVTIKAHQFIVESGSIVDGSGRSSYPRTTKEKENGQGPGGGRGGSIGSGAGHGGWGGGTTNGTPGGSTYGTATGYEALEGSTGGAGYYYQSYGGRGGAAIRIIAENVTTAGVIYMNGELGGNHYGGGYAGGGGSGGTIVIQAKIWNHTGLISARGGWGGSSNSGGGAGGRIKAYYETKIGSGDFNVSGGGSGYNSGDKGTIHQAVETYVVPFSQTYATSGTRIVTIPLHFVDRVDTTAIAWQATTPQGTSITIETSLDGVNWTPVTNGGAIPGIQRGDNLKNSPKQLYIRQTLTTTNTNITPQLHELTVVITRITTQERDETLTSYVSSIQSSVEVLYISPNKNVQSHIKPIQSSVSCSFVKNIEVTSHTQPIATSHIKGVTRFHKVESHTSRIKGSTFVSKLFLSWKLTIDTQSEWKRYKAEETQSNVLIQSDGTITIADKSSVAYYFGGPIPLPKVIRVGKTRVTWVGIHSDTYPVFFRVNDGWRGATNGGSIPTIPVDQMLRGNEALQFEIVLNNATKIGGVKSVFDSITFEIYGVIGDYGTEYETIVTSAAKPIQSKVISIPDDYGYRYYDNNYEDFASGTLINVEALPTGSLRLKKGSASAVRKVETFEDPTTRVWYLTTSGGWYRDMPGGAYDGIYVWRSPRYMNPKTSAITTLSITTPMGATNSTITIPYLINAETDDKFIIRKTDGTVLLEQYGRGRLHTPTWQIFTYRAQPGEMTGFELIFQKGSSSSNPTQCVMIDSIQHYYDGEGYQNAGARTSPPYDLTYVGEAGRSFIEWSADVPNLTDVKIRVRIDDGPYVDAINGGLVPGIKPGMDLTGKKMYVEQYLTTKLNDVTPILYSVMAVIHPQRTITSHVSPITGSVEATLATVKNITSHVKPIGSNVDVSGLGKYAVTVSSYIASILTQSKREGVWSITPTPSHLKRITGDSERSGVGSRTEASFVKPITGHVYHGNELFTVTSHVSPIHSHVKTGKAVTVYASSYMQSIAGAVRWIKKERFHYEEDTQADFQKGTLYNVVATPEGDLKLQSSLQDVYLGYITETPSSFGGTLEELIVWRFTAKGDGVLKSVRLYGRGTNNNMRVAIYTDNNDLPGTLITQSNRIVSGNKLQYDYFPLQQPVNLKHGQKFWVAFYAYGGTSYYGLRGSRESEGIGLKPDLSRYRRDAPITYVTSGFPTTIPDPSSMAISSFNVNWNIQCIIEQNYHNPVGYRISEPIPLATLSNKVIPLITYEATTPIGTGITIETSLDNGSTWQPIGSDGSVQGIQDQDVTDKYLLIRETLTTTIPSTGPILHRLLFRVGKYFTPILVSYLKPISTSHTKAKIASFTPMNHLQVIEGGVARQGFGARTEVNFISSIETHIQRAGNGSREVESHTKGVSTFVERTRTWNTLKSSTVTPISSDVFRQGNGSRLSNSYAIHLIAKVTAKFLRSAFFEPLGYVSLIAGDATRQGIGSRAEVTFVSHSGTQTHVSQTFNQQLESRVNPMDTEVFIGKIRSFITESHMQAIFGYNFSRWTKRLIQLVAHIQPIVSRIEFDNEIYAVVKAIEEQMVALLIEEQQTILTPEQQQAILEVTEQVITLLLEENHTKVRVS